MEKFWNDTLITGNKEQIKQKLVDYIDALPDFEKSTLNLSGNIRLAKVVEKDESPLE